VRIALDATYSVDPRPTGIGVYSNALLIGLADQYPNDDFLHCYRPKQFIRAPHNRRPNVRRRLLQPPLPIFGAELFHALNQRVDRRPARKVVSTFHDLFVITEEYSSAEFRARFTAQARRAAQNSDLIIAVSQFTAGQVVELLGFDGSRIRIVPHGVYRPPSFLERRKREKIILFVGALQARKNVARLVEAFESAPSDWRLILAGASTGYGSEAILERIRASRCQQRIQIIGYISPAELQTLYSRASIFAFPSLDEGFGIPVLEAMSQGVPVIISNRPSLKEIAGDAALMVDPYRTEELESALERLIGDPDLREEYAGRGRRCAELYSWERTVRETYRVYRELLG
jgi:glycosyltransferase involved in cell wall biosynthesis